MNKLKLFLENFLVYGLGGIISKMIPLLMLPVITRLMPDVSYFGISDLSNTIISFFGAFAGMGMYDAMYRYFFEKEDEKYKQAICSTALFFTTIVSVIVFVSMLLFKEKLAMLFFKDTRYSYVIYISAFATLVSATNGIIAAPTRMQNKRKIYLITNLSVAVLGYAIAMLFLLNGYYIIAMPLGLAMAAFILEIAFGVLNHSWFHLKMIEKKLLKPLLSLAIPIMPNFLIYWIFNSCDKLMITDMMGLGATGVYSVSSKVGQVSQLIYTAFAGGWQFFAFSTMKDEKQIHTNSKVFEYLGVISFAATMILCTFSRLIFEIAFPKQYLAGYVLAPYLFLAPLMLMLYQVIGNQFLVIKKTWPSLLILSCGAIINVLLNARLIPILGIEGAAIATLSGYTAAVVMCTIVLLKMKLMFLSKRMFAVFAFMLCYLVLWRLHISDKALLGGIAAWGVMGIYLALYRKELRRVKLYLLGADSIKRN